MFELFDNKHEGDENLNTTHLSIAIHKHTP